MNSMKLRKKLGLVMRFSSLRVSLKSDIYLDREIYSFAVIFVISEAIRNTNFTSNLDAS